MLLMSTYTIRFHGEIRKNIVDTPSYLELYKPSTTCLYSSHMGPLSFAVISSLYGILLGNAVFVLQSFYMHYWLQKTIIISMAFVI